MHAAAVPLLGLEGSLDVVLPGELCNAENRGSVPDAVSRDRDTVCITSSIARMPCGTARELVHCAPGSSRGKGTTHKRSTDCIIRSHS